ncbi:Maltase A3 [Sergentomyia squamirostris]
MRIYFVVSLLCLISAVRSNDPNWWRSANVYQIYPRSFKDSDGDGIGDLNGIRQQLPYLKDLGITVFWMSPIFKSPMVDFGYDISDFFDIHEDFGTMENFEQLVNTAHDLGIKVVLDFVPNHSSDENEWFKLSAQKDATYKDWYVWHPGKVNVTNPEGPKLPPSNWLSEFRGSSWGWHEGRGEFFLHQFALGQPDLNYRNPAVVNKMKDVLRFWLGKGVDGFRVDTVPHLFEVAPDAQGNYPDEPLSGLTDDPDNHGYLDHIYTMNQDETIDMVYQWRAVLDEVTKTTGITRILLTEAYSSIDTVMKYYGNGQKNGSHVPFNFQMIMNVKNESNALAYHKYIREWLDKLPSGSVANWVLGNHDQRRIASRFGTHRIDLINMILNTLPGIAITYNGEEIGMTDVYLSWKDTVDPAACNSNEQIYEEFSRDPARTPFQWDSTTSAGFSTNSKPWLPVSPLYREVNVKAQKSAYRSHLKVYRQLLRLRTTPTLRRGSADIRTHGSNVLSIVRRLRGRETYITVANVGGERELVDLREFSTEQFIYVIVSVASRKMPGEMTKGPTLVLDPYESVVLRSLRS